MGEIFKHTCRILILVEFELDPSAYLEWTGGHVVICRCKRFQKSHVAYYSNCMSDVSLVIGGDIHPQPGPTRQCKESAKFDIPKALKANVINSLTWLSSPWNQERISVSLKTPYCKMASLSSPYLKCGQIYLCLTQASIDLVTNSLDRIVDNIKLEVACASTPRQPQDCWAWEFIICLRQWLSTTLAMSSMQKVQIVF